MYRESSGVLPLKYVKLILEWIVTARCRATLSTPMPLLHVKYGSTSFFMPFRANDSVLALRIACELKLNKHDAFSIVNLQTR